MEKKADKSHTVICDLLRCLVDYSESLRIFPSEAIENKETTQTYHFVVSSPDDRLEALAKLLFEDEIKIPSRRGPKGFEEYDRDLIEQMHAERQETGESLEKLLDKYTQLAQARSSETDDESVRSRLLRASRRYAKERKKLYDYGEDEGMGLFEGAEHELSILLPWLEEYRPELINLLKP